jgi:hypothetical protein
VSSCPTQTTAGRSGPSFYGTPSREEVVKERAELVAEQKKFQADSARLQAYDAKLQERSKDLEKVWVPEHLFAFVTAASNKESHLEPHKDGKIKLGMVLCLYNPSPFAIRVRKVEIKLDAGLGLKDTYERPDAFVVAGADTERLMIYFSVRNSEFATLTVNGNRVTSVEAKFVEGKVVAGLLRDATDMMKQEPKEEATVRIAPMIVQVPVNWDPYNAE